MQLGMQVVQREDGQSSSEYQAGGTHDGDEGMVGILRTRLHTDLEIYIMLSSRTDHPNGLGRVIRPVLLISQVRARTTTGSKFGYILSHLPSRLYISPVILPY